ncbi:YkgJ family cysteine cluster protein [Pyxidicoccus fallax]|uniref:YkgJ family cysteine cluster protein n=1 Tax=Pyxidicoccus fallax TaxID=394095 RepID=A0A848LM74_9BACT|nr:YkgJ family cysteine cluster protein [Pyxidicoccus fallax]NMO18878.1 YkgJ family cysteine cluster protein [Pyxidicoccus fallax]NPC80523.1 YkgJ family cysteine cluster protein [Pyxidicoccus fallax]
MPLSTLCLRCGMCCDGTLFTHVSLQPPEVTALEARGLPLTRRADGSPALAQHCAALDGRTCTVYADRPASCRRYHCQLYAALAEKEVSLDEALAVVDEARARVDAVGQELPPASEGEPRSVMQRARRAEQPEHGGPLAPKAQAARERAEAFLDKHFRGRFGRRE